MKIVRITGNPGQPVVLTLECEHCLARFGRIKRSGHDDEHFRTKVLPKIECTSCGLPAPGAAV